MIKAIETLYDGYRFRSRLEARWAVFFNTLGIKYEYEPEGFELPNGMRYLPDFKIKCWGSRGEIFDKPYDLYIEVKGEMTYDDAVRLKSFAGDYMEEYCDGFIRNWWGIKHRLLVVGNIPNVENVYDLSNSIIFENYDCMNNIEIYPFNYELIDGDYFAAYPAISGDKFYLWGDDSNYINGSETDKIRMIAAYQAARQARFEYGEVGA